MLGLKFIQKIVCYHLVILFVASYQADQLSKSKPRTLREILEALVSRNVATADMFMWMDLPPSKLSSSEETWCKKGIKMVCGLLTSRFFR